MKGTIRKAALLSALSMTLIGAPSVAMADTPLGNNAVIAVATGYSYTLAVRADHSLIGWGANGSGQLGGNSGQNAPLPVNVYDPAGSFSTVKQVSARGEHSLALKQDGTVWEWGGVDQTPPIGMMTYTYQPKQVNNLSGIVAIAAGEDHSLAIKADGTVYAWGANAEGQLGTTTMAFVEEPIQVSDPADPTGFLTGAKAAAAGNGHSVILKADGTVWAWGKNQQGQLGNGAEHDEYGYYYQPAVVSQPTQVVGLEDVQTVAAGGNHTLAVKQDGTVWTWGDNMYNQLGNGADIYGSQSTPHQVKDLNDPTGNLTGVTAIAGGTYHSLALKSDGTVRGFGLGGYGQAGYREPGTSSMLNSANPFRDPSDHTRNFDGVVAISAGGSYSVLVKADGTVWSSGENYSGQLADGTTSHQRNLVQAKLINDYTAPVFVQAETDASGSVIYVHFNETLSGMGLSTTAFTLHGTGALMSGTSVDSYGYDLKGDTLTISLSSNIAKGQAVTLDWANGAVKDVFGNPVQAARGVAVQNNVQ